MDSNIDCCVRVCCVSVCLVEEKTKRNIYLYKYIYVLREKSKRTSPIFAKGITTKSKISRRANHIFAEDIRTKSKGHTNKK